MPPPPQRLVRQMRLLLLLLLILLLACVHPTSLLFANGSRLLPGMVLPVPRDVPRVTLAEYRRSLRPPRRDDRRRGDATAAAAAEKSGPAPAYERTEETPVLVRGVITAADSERLCAALVQAAGAAVVDLQRRRPREAARVYPLPLRTAIDVLMTSRHDDALWCFQENLLLDSTDDKANDAALKAIASELKRVKQSVFAVDDDGADPDWFDYFPPGAQPTDCVVLAGEGATSTLHRDPWEWTGTSICLEGSKVWRFIAPHPTVCDVDDIVRSYRLPSTAWGDSPGVLSAGWQSDYTLYETRRAGIMSAREWSELIDSGGGNSKRERMMEIARSTRDLTPSAELLVPAAATAPPTAPATNVTLWTTVQEAGDVLVIPAHWWHQTYALEASVAVSSQRCSARDARRVLNHMRKATTAGGGGGADRDDAELWWCDPSLRPQDIVDRYFQRVSAPDTNDARGGRTG